MLPADGGPKLISAARGAIDEALGGPRDAIDAEPWMLSPLATFVTLRQEDELRGCVGSIVARRPVLEDVRSNALGAAFRDPRFAPLAAHELPHTRIEVAVLTAPVEIAATTEEEVIASLVPQVDGVIFHVGELRSVFLPQVWKDLPDPRDFLAHLKKKAGLAADFWSRSVRVERFHTEKFVEERPPRRREMLS